MLFNATRAQEVLGREGLDAVVATKTQNVFYMTGLAGLFYPLSTNLGAAAIFAAGDTAATLAISTRAMINEQERWAGETVQFGTRSYMDAEAGAKLRDEEAAMAAVTVSSSATDIYGAIAGVLADRGLSSKTIGFDDSDVQAVFERQHAGVKSRGAFDVLRNIRAVKTAAELDRLKAGLAANERAFHDVFKAARVGADWHALTSTFEASFLKLGGRLPYQAGGIGYRSVAHFHGAGDPARASDVIFFDAGGTFQNYWTDTGRTLVLGKPTARQQEVAGIEAEGLAAVQAVAKPGVAAIDVFRTFEETVRKRGIDRSDWFHGHGVGLELYEVPNIRPGTKDVLEEGMAFNFESPYRQLGVGGLHMEDFFFVRASGAERISTLPRGLIEL